MKAAIKREQSQACLSYAEREQARCETSTLTFMITEVKKLQETREEIHKVLADLNTSEKKYLKAMAFNFVDYLEQVQRMPLVLRLALYHVVFCLFDLLLRNRQLGRREGAFDTETREAIRSVLSENLEDYYDE